MTATPFNPLLGQAIGDRIGGPVRMAMMLGHAIADAHGLDTTIVVQRYLAWHRSDAFDTGPTWSAVLEHINIGIAPETAAQRVHAEQRGLTAGANTAHRATAIGCVESTTGTITNRPLTLAAVGPSYLGGPAAGPSASAARLP